MSLFAIGGGNSAVPEMHRFAVDVQHWLTDRQFGDSFALAQLTPGPNVIIVTLIGYHVAGVIGAHDNDAGDVRAACLVCFFRRRCLRSLQGQERGTAHEPGTGAGDARADRGQRRHRRGDGGLQLDVTWITVGTALTAYFVRVHPLWTFAVAARLGMSGLL